MRHIGTSGMLLLLAGCGTSPDLASPEPYPRYLGVRELAETPDAPSVAEIVRRLEDPHPLVVVGALEALAAIGHPEFLQHVAPKLGHDDVLVRRQACATLAAIRNEAGIPRLLEAMKDPDAHVRRGAVKALAAFGKRAESLPALQGALADEDPGTARLAHEALAELTGRTDVAPTPDAWREALK
jgi:HEAT repeat protein